MRSLHIQLSDPTFAAIAQVAAAHGLTVEAVVAEQLAADFGDDEAIDRFFTPEILAEIDDAREEAKREGGLTLDQVREMRLAKSQAWCESRSA